MIMAREMNCPGEDWELDGCDLGRTFFLRVAASVGPCAHGDYQHVVFVAERPNASACPNPGARRLGDSYL